MLDPLVNRGLEFGDVVEGSSPDALASDFGEQPLDEVEPGAGCRRLCRANQRFTAGVLWVA
ncbi:hypothetical protein IVB32_03615 [Bradyrhizobium sp. 23]|nr:hypothetical protein [Bradyrhizobium sp. 23]